MSQMHCLCSLLLGHKILQRSSNLSQTSFLDLCFFSTSAGKTQVQDEMRSKLQTHKQNKSEAREPHAIQKRFSSHRTGETPHKKICGSGFCNFQNDPVCRQDQEAIAAFRFVLPVADPLSTFFSGVGGLAKILIFLGKLRAAPSCNLTPNSSQIEAVFRRDLEYLFCSYKVSTNFEAKKRLFSFLQCFAFYL